MSCDTVVTPTARQAKTARPVLGFAAAVAPNLANVAATNGATNTDPSRRSHPSNPASPIGRAGAHPRRSRSSARSSALITVRLVGVGRPGRIVALIDDARVAGAQTSQRWRVK